MYEINLEEIDENYRKFFEFTNGELVLDSIDNLDTLYSLMSNIMDISGMFINGSNKYIGSLSKSYGYGKCVGIVSKDLRIRWRLDYDEISGVHMHYENIAYGKGNKAIKIIIPISITYQNYKKTLNKWNRM